MNDKLERELKHVFEHTKTLLTNNITNLFSNQKLKSLSMDDMRTLLSIISATVDQSHFQSSKVFLDVVNEVVSEKQPVVQEKSKKK